MILNFMLSFIVLILCKAYDLYLQILKIHNYIVGENAQASIIC